MEQTNKEYLKRSIDAAQQYLLIHLVTVLSAGGITAPTREEMESFLSVALDITRKEMDDTIITAEITEHGVHWVLDLTVEIEGEKETVELPVHGISPLTTNICVPEAFLTEAIRMCVLELETPYINAVTIKHVSKKLEEMFAQCKGCENCYYLEQVIFRHGLPQFCVRVKIGGAHQDNLFMTYEIPWPRL